MSDDDNFPVDDAWLAHASYLGEPVEGYSIDKDLSGRLATTYINDENGSATVAYSGTNFKTKSWVRPLEDIWADTEIVRGTEEQSPYFIHAADLAQKAVQKYGRDNVHFTGHSLGGTKALYASNTTGARATAFNPGFTPLDVVTHGTRVSPLQWDFSRSDAYVVPGDPVSSSAFLQKGLRIHTVKPGKGMPGVTDPLKHIITLDPYGFVKDIIDYVNATHGMENSNFLRERKRPAKLPPVPAVINIPDAPLPPPIEPIRPKQVLTLPRRPLRDGTLGRRSAPPHV